MGLKPARSGERHEIYFYVDESGHCEAGAYLRDLKNGGKREQQDAALLAKRINDLANFGPPRLQEHGHSLREGVNELKARNGARLFWFYAHGGIVICSHGAHKPISNRAYNPHIERAKAVREQVEAEFHREPEEAKAGKVSPLRATTKPAGKKQPAERRKR
jgi:hypothetical protein